MPGSGVCMCSWFTSDKLGYRFLGFRRCLDERSSQKEYVLEALKCGKHVLLNDPVSTSMSEFVEQQSLAKKYGKFIQFSTMFVYQFQGKVTSS